ncbi:MAG: hypothetical protein LBB81_01035 [Treponema sp.]|jgi:uncharacterized membrane protein|nr:hypothetical protein [Treponema sp.]
MRILNFKYRTKFLFGLIAVLYPLLVFCVLVVLKLPIRYLSIGIIIFAIAYSIFNSRNYKGKNTAALFISPAILCIIGAASFLLDDFNVIKLYPVLADLSYITIMVTSFFFPPPLAYYFIDIFDKSMKTKIPQDNFYRYCLRASVVWVIFFIVDGIISLITVYHSSDFFWGIYNGGITYCMMGLIFAGEFIILKIIEKKHRLKYTHPEILKEGEGVDS